MMKREKAPQKRQMRLAPGGDPLVIVAIADRPAHDEKQNLRQRMRCPPRFARILNRREMIQQRPKAGLLRKSKIDKLHDRGSRIKAAQQNQTSRQTLNRVNPSSEPCTSACRP
jgi:hypothetical protein